jgi:hypothetical protein
VINDEAPAFVWRLPTTAWQGNVECRKKPEFTNAETDQSQICDLDFVILSLLGIRY